MATEATVLPKVRLALSKLGIINFRNNIGLAWQGPAKDQPVRYGLGTGTSDLIGWRSIEITQDMVGQKIAQFVAVECKRPSGGRITPEQQNFLDRVQEAGGLSGIARSEDDVVALDSQ